MNAGANTSSIFRNLLLKLIFKNKNWRNTKYKTDTSVAVIEADFVRDDFVLSFDDEDNVDAVSVVAVAAVVEEDDDGDAAVADLSSSFEDFDFSLSLSFSLRDDDEVVDVAFDVDEELLPLDVVVDVVEVVVASAVDEFVLFNADLLPDDDEATAADNVEDDVDDFVVDVVLVDVLRDDDETVFVTIIDTA